VALAMINNLYKKLLVCLTILVFSSACSDDYTYSPPEGSNEIAITRVSFGEMVINGNLRKADLVIHPDGKLSTWGFDFDSHLVEINNIAKYVDDKIKVLIIGTGYNGQGELNEDTKKYIDQLKSDNIEVHVLPTPKAAEKFNSLPKEGLVACFHLNC
jgi:hypothetical protein